MANWSLYTCVIPDAGNTTRTLSIMIDESKSYMIYITLHQIGLLQLREWSTGGVRSAAMQVA